MSSTTALTKFEKLFSSDEPLKLECGETINHIDVAYQTFGELNHQKDNVIMVNHALTGNSHVAGIITDEEIQNCSDKQFLTKYNKMFSGKVGWWEPLIGPNKVLDTNKYFVICSNVLGSCYGTTGPTELNSITNEEYRYSLPEISVRDMVKVQKELFDKLGISSIKLAIGGSLGGMQIFEWALMYPDMIESIMPIAASVGHSPWAIGLNESQRNAIKNDPKWNSGNYDSQPVDGISLARKIAMITYRSYGSFKQKFGRKLTEQKNYFEVESYLDYQGEKISKRFDANTYLYLSEAMDLYDVGKNRGGIESALNQINCKTEIVGISTDILYPPEEQKEIASMIKGASYSELESLHGHDAFLIEFDQLEKIIGDFLD